MDSLPLEKPFPGFLDPLLRGVDGQHPVYSKNNDIFGSAEILRTAGAIFFTIIPGTLSFQPGKHSSMNSGYFQGYFLPGPVV